MTINQLAVRQLYACARLDGVRQAVGFPDLHPGKGVPVGGAFVTEGVIYPHLIGGDIGCGMTLWQRDLPLRKAKVDRWTKLPFNLETRWDGNLGGWLQDNRLASSPFDASMGTLGGGNHFAELQAVEEICDGNELTSIGLHKADLVLLVHSGSRDYGESIFRTHVAEHSADGVDPESPAGATYLAQHNRALRWARANRELVVQRFLDALGADGQSVWDDCHNSILPIKADGGTVWLHRKGAVAVEAGPLVIPGSRGALSYVVQPVGDGASHAWSLSQLGHGGSGPVGPMVAGRVRGKVALNPDRHIRDEANEVLNATCGEVGRRATTQGLVASATAWEAARSVAACRT